MLTTMQKQTTDEIQKQTALVTNLACFLGRFNSKRMTYTWNYKGLFVVVNKERGYTIAMYQHVVVLSNLFPSDPIYVKGNWLDLINELHAQIKQAKAERERESIRESIVDPKIPQSAELF